MSTKEWRGCRLALAIAVISVPATSMAEKATPVAPGAMPNDRNMTCTDIATERATIDAAIADAAAKQAAAKKTKKRLFGFAKGLAGFAIPGASLGLGGSSPLGSMAVQQAQQAAMNAVSNAGASGGLPESVKPTDAQQDRLTRLASIAAFRRCA